MERLARSSAPLTDVPSVVRRRSVTAVARETEQTFFSAGMVGAVERTTTPEEVFMFRTLCFVALASLPACELLEGIDSDGATRLADTGLEPGEAGGSEAESGNGSKSGGWTLRNHTCYGDGIDAMWWDVNEQSVWIGCGSNTSGYGLHHSPDRGETWPSVSTDPRGAADGRVNAISRSSDGLLYIAGAQLLGSQVVALDTATTPFGAEVVYAAGALIDDVQLAGSFARNEDGVSVVESLNGTQIAVQWTPGGFWQDAAGWAGGASVQMQHLMVHDNEFYGTGSTMNDAPMVFLPPRSGHVEADGFMLSVVSLSQWAQELRNLDIDDAGSLIVGGTDHGANSGVIYISNEDPRNAADWTEVWVADMLGNNPTWIDGVCREGDNVAAVGRFSTNNEPIALLSTDAGQTWSDLTMNLNADAPLYRCAFLDGGQTVAVGGGSGFLGFYGL